MKTRIFIGGSRGICDPLYMRAKLTMLLFKKELELTDIIIVSGGAQGVDTMAREFALSKDVEFEEYPADWIKYGSIAGRVRNSQMAKIVDEALIIWDGHSTGTAHMIQELQMNGIVPQIHIP